MASEKVSLRVGFNCKEMRTKKRFTKEHERKEVIGRLSYRQPSGGHHRMPVFGPLGFLNLLETRLGLFRAECVNA